MHTRTLLPFMRTPVALAVSLSLGSIPAALAGPTGGVVTGGQGTISNPNSGTTLINQSSNQLNINWNTFNVNSGESVLFHQPSSTAVAFNNILDQNPSQIFGLVQGNGQVVLVNPNGFLIGRTGVLDVNSLVLSSLQAIDFNAASGRYSLASLTNPGAIINEGTITAGRGGSVTLLGGAVSNSGSIVADYGTVNLAAGRTATLDFAGDGLLRLEVGSDVVSNPTGATSAVENSGSISANGGQVLLSAAAVQGVFANLINNTGVVRANRINNTGGTIELLGPEGDVVSTGTLDAAAGDAQSTGGSVTLVGNRVGLFGNAVVNVSGATGGGTAYIGGGDHGTDSNVPDAEETVVSSGATINADAGTTGTGGHVVVWSNDYTDFAGAISARGGSVSGDGGYTEVSGKAGLQFSGSTDLTAAHGAWGTLLLDPAMLDIVTTTDPNAPSTTPTGVTGSGGTYTWPYSSTDSGYITDAQVVSLLTQGNVTLQGTSSATLETGTSIDVSAVTGAASHSLEIDSNGTIDLFGTIKTNNGAVTISATNLSGTTTALSPPVVNVESSASISSGTAALSISGDAGVRLYGGSVSGGQVSVGTDGDSILNAGSGTPTTIVGSTSVSLDALSGSVGSATNQILTQTGSLSMSAVNEHVVNSGGALTVTNALSSFGSSGGTLSITNTGGGITAESVTTATGGTILLTAAGPIQVKTLSTGSTGTGSVTLTALSGAPTPDSTYTIADTSTGSSAISTGTLTLQADGNIGSSAAPLTTAVGTLSASSNGGSIYLAQSGSALTVTQATANASSGNSGAVQISNTGGSLSVADVTTGTSGSVSLDVSKNADTTSNTTYTISETGATPITTGSLTLAAGSNIGSSSAALAVQAGSISAVSNTGSVYLAQSGEDATVSAAQANAVSGTAGTVKIINSGGALTATTVSTGTGGAVDLEATGNLVVDTVNASSTGTVTLKATGGGTGYANTDTLSETGTSPMVTAGTVNLTADSDIGSSGTAFNITAGTLNASAGGSAYVGQSGNLVISSLSVGPAGTASLVSDGQITVDSVSAPDGTTTGGTVTLQGTSIVAGTPSGSNPMISVGPLGTISLDATDGGIGSSGAVFSISGGLLNATTNNPTAPGADIFVNSVGTMTAGTINASGGSSNAQLTTTSGSINGSNDVLTAAIASLEANNGSVGSSSAAVKTSVGELATVSGTNVYVTQSGSGSLFLSNISASGNINIDDGSGQLTVASVSGGQVALSAGSIVGGANDTLSAVGELSLTATSGSINGPGSALLFEAGTLTGSAAGLINMASTNSVALQGLSAGSSITVSTGNSSGNTDITLDGVSVSSASGQVTLTADGSILQNSTGVLAANSVQLTATNGNIGAPGNSIITKVASLTTSSGGDTYVDNSADTGSLTLGTMVDTNGVGDITLASGGTIDGGALESSSLNLTASGSIGGGAAIPTSATYITAQSTHGGVALNAQSGPVVTLNTVSAGGGDVNVTAPAELAVTSVSASGNVTLKASNGSIEATGSNPEISGQVLNLQAYADIGASGTPLPTAAATSLSATSGNGSIYISQSGSFTLTNAAVSGANTGINITDTTGDITVGTVSASSSASAPGTVSLTSSQGAILASTTGTSEISAGQAINLTAKTDVGTVTDFATLAGTPINVSTTGGSLTVKATDGTGQINLDIGGTPVISAGGITLGSGTGASGIVVLQSPTDLNVSNLAAGAISIGNQNTASVGLSSGGTLTLPASEVVTDYAPQNLFVQGASVVGPGGVTDFSFTAGELSFHSGAAGVTTTLNTTVSRLDASVGSGSTLDVNQTGNLVLGSIVAPSGAITITAPGATLTNDGVSTDVLTASSLNLSGGSIGAPGSGGAINTQASTVNGTATGGGIYIEQNGAMTLTAYASGAVDVQTSLGSLTADTVNAGGGASLSTTGASSDVIVNGPINGAGGGVSLQASGAGSNIDLNAQVTTSGPALIESTSVSSPGAIVTGSGNEVVSNGLTVVAAAIGSSSIPLNTQVATLTATSGSGGIYVTDAGSLNLSATASGGFVDVQTPNGALTVASASGAGVTLGSGGVLTLDGAVNGNGSTVTLTATGAIDSNGGAVSANTLIATGASIGAPNAVLNTTAAQLIGTASSGDIYVTNTGNLNLTASAPSGTVQVSTPNASLTVASVAGSNVDLTTTGSGNALVIDGTVSATNDASLQSAGAIVPGTGNQVSASDLVLRGTFIGTNSNLLNVGSGTVDVATTNGGLFLNGAGTGVLVLTAAATNGAVDVQVPGGSLSVASASGDGVTLSTGGAAGTLALNGTVDGRAGEVSLATTGAGSDIDLNSTIKSTSQISVAATGNIVAGAGSSLTTPTLQLSGSSIGGSAAPIDTDASTVNATSSSGGIFLDDTGGVVLTANATGGALDVQADGLLTVDSASGAGVTLLATNSSIDVNGTLSGGSGPVALTAGAAGGTITLDGTLSTSGDVTLVAGTSASPGAISTGTGGEVMAAALTATGSTVGTAANPLNTSVGVLTSTSSNGGTYINNSAGLALNSSVTGGTLNVQSNGSITVDGASGNGVTLVAGGAGSSISVNGALNAGTGAVALTAGTTASPGAILEGSGGAVTGSGLTATAASVGTAAAPLATNISTITADATQGGIYVTNQNGLTLTSVQSSGDASFTASSGNLSVESVDVGGSASLTASAGTITDATNSSPLTAKSLTLLAHSIGAPSTLTATGVDYSTRLNIDTGTLNATSTAGGIYINALGSTGLSSVSVQASGGSAGNIELLAPEGSLYLQSVSASNTLLLAAGLNIYGLSGLGAITAQSAELRAGAADQSTGHIGTVTDPLRFQLAAGNTLRIFVPQTVDYHDPARAPATLPNSGVVTTLSLYASPSDLAVEAGFDQFQGLTDSLYTSPAESLVHSIQNQTTILQNVVGLDWSSFDPNISLFSTRDPSVCLPSDQRDEEAGPPGC